MLKPTLLKLHCSLIILTLVHGPAKLGAHSLSEAESLYGFFNPRPGENINVDYNALDNRAEKSPLRLRGWIQVSPPKGECLIISKHRELPDVKICSKQAVAFELREIGPSGSLNWQVRRGLDTSFSHPLSWSSPYRLAQWIAPSEKTPRWIPLRKCEYLADSNEIILHHFSALTRWTIQLPGEHVVMPQKPEVPNLFMRRIQRKRSGIPGKQKIDPNRMEAPFSFPEIKREDPVTTHWAMTSRNTFTMSAKNFRFDRTQSQEMGECRYQFSGADQDPTSGWIECHSAYDYEVLLAPLTCADQIPPPVIGETPPESVETEE